MIMATKSEIAQDMNAHGYNGFLTVTQISEYTGCNRRKIGRIVAGLSTLGSNSGKRYYYEDVAFALSKNGEVGNADPQRRRAGRQPKSVFE
jgi:hypothetical protein